MFPAMPTSWNEVAPAAEGAGSLAAPAGVPPVASAHLGPTARCRRPSNRARNGTFPRPPPSRPVSIMNKEPPLPKGAEAAAQAPPAARANRPVARRADAGTGSRPPPKRPPPPSASSHKRPRRPLALTSGHAQAGRADVQIRPDRQSRRNRLPHRPHRARGWACARSRSIPRPTRRRCMCGAPTRRVAIGPAPAAQSYLAHRQAHRRGQAGARRLHPSRLRIPVGKRRFRASLHRRRHRLRRPAAAGDPRHGPEGPRQGADGKSRRAGGAGLSRRAAGAEIPQARRPTRSAIRC